jgi:hypothetical protein
MNTIVGRIFNRDFVLVEVLFFGRQPRFINDYWTQRLKNSNNVI